MGIIRKSGQCLAVIYSNIVALNTRLFARFVRRHPSKQINTKKLPEKFLDASENHKTSANLSVRDYFWQFLIGMRRILVIHRNHLVRYACLSVPNCKLLENILFGFA